MKKLILLLLTAASLSAAPQAVVFDFGGVMTGQQKKQAVISFLRESLNLTTAEFEKANLEKKQASKAGFTDSQFWQELANKKGIQLSTDWPCQFNSVMKDAIGVNPEMYALVDQLKENQVPVALLSNIDDRLSKILREFGLYDPFQPCLLSCEIGVEKPDPKAYEILIDQLNLNPSEIIFIDDRIENIEEANKIGLDAILFQSPSQIQQELQSRHLLPSPLDGKNGKNGEDGTNGRSCLFGKAGNGGNGGNAD